MNLKRALWLSVLSVSSLALADPPAAAPADKPAVAAPSPEAVKSVWQFYYKGKGSGLVLADSKLCLEVSTKGDDKSECTKEVPAEGVKAGTSVLIWQAYVVPQGDTVEDLTIQVKQGDVVRETKDVSKISGEGWRMRTWNGVRPSKAGTWTFTLQRGSTPIKTFTLTVT